jgi:hypothetical protein
MELETSKGVNSLSRSKVRDHAPFFLIADFLAVGDVSLLNSRLDTP